MAGEGAHVFLDAWSPLSTPPHSNKTLLKVKVFHDEEALVLGHENGSGRLQNMMGKIHVKLANDVKASGRAGERHGRWR